MKTNKISGMFWHCHHDTLCDYVWDYQERVDYIKRNKPKNEIKTRLRLFKKIKGKLPAGFVEARDKLNEAWDKLNEAGKKYDEARDKLNEACKKRDEAGDKRVEAWDKLNEAWEKYASEIEALHKKECGCKEWNGKTLVFKEKNK